MSRVGRVGSLRFNRVQGAYAGHQRTSLAVDKAEPVEAALYAQNNPDLSSDSQLIAYDNYYKNLKKMEKDFDDFLKDTDQLKDRVSKERKHAEKDMTSELYRRIKVLISKYNSTIEALEYIDKKYKTNNLQELNFILISYEESLANMGIAIRDLRMEINGGVFWRNFLKSQDPYEEMFRPLSRLVLNLFIKFRNIMVVRKNKYSSFSEDYKGTIINRAF